MVAPLLLAPARHWFRWLVLGLAVVLLAGCRVDVVVDIRVHDDGGGTVTAAVGLDDDALARVGNLERQLRAEDLAAAGWAVAAPTREGDRTWIRATKEFDDAEAGEAALAELTGSDGPFRDFDVTVDEGVFGKTYEVTGTVDLRDGPAAFGDDELRAALGGDPFGGTLEVIEREEGRSVAEMVEFAVRVHLPGQDEPTVYSPRFTDGEPTAIEASSTSRSALATVAIWSVVAVVAVVGLVALRQGFRRVGR